MRYLPFAAPLLCLPLCACPGAVPQPTLQTVQSDVLLAIGMAKAAADSASQTSTPQAKAAVAAADQEAAALMQAVEQLHSFSVGDALKAVQAYQAALPSGALPPLVVTALATAEAIAEAYLAGVPAPSTSMAAVVAYAH